MSVVITATVEDSNSPPRVKLEVLNSGGTLYDEVTIYRLDANGRTVPVRTQDGGPLQLTLSGSDMVGLVYDYEVPYGTLVSYGTNEEGLSANDLTVPSSSIWLVSPGVPEVSTTLFLRPGSLREEALPANRGVFSPLGRQHPVVVTDGVRKGIQSTLIALTQTPDEFAALKAVLASTASLLLNIPADKDYGFDTAYISVGDVKVSRLGGWLGDPLRDVEMPFVVVDRPPGGTQAERTYADVVAENSTYESVAADYADYAELLAPTT